MTYRRRQEPFLGELPAVAPGQPVECRDATGEWHPMVAMSGPRYDHEHAAGRTCWMSVAVATPEDYARDGELAAWVNWPVADVRGVGG